MHIKHDEECKVSKLLNLHTDTKTEATLKLHPLEGGEG